MPDTAKSKDSDYPSPLSSYFENTVSINVFARAWTFLIVKVMEEPILGTLLTPCYVKHGCHLPNPYQHRHSLETC